MDTHWTDLPKLTVSSIADTSCALKFQRLRIDKTGWGLKREGPPVTVPRGKAVHDALLFLHQNRWEDQVPMHKVNTLAQQAVQAARYERGVDKDGEVKRVVEAVRLFCDNQDAEDVLSIQALETQIEFDYKYKGRKLVRMSATIDRVLVRPTMPRRLVVQDYKTTRQKIDLRECFLLLYCARQKWTEYDEYVLEMIWIDVEEHQVLMDVIEARHVSGQLGLITAALLRILDNEPIPEPGPQCTFCPMREGCQGLDAVDLDDDEVDNPFGLADASDA